MTKLKICGITREADACFAARAGADFLGLIFVPDSPRAVTAARALAIGEAVRSTGSAARLVGVFRNAAREEVMRNAVDARLDFVQLHGNEDDDFLRTLSVPVIKTVHVGEERPDFAGFPSATWLLFDTLHDRLAGGTGSRFDWSLLAGSERGQPFFLAGGITPENVAAAVAVVHPDAIDVSSGVESAPGIKDPAKIELLVRAIQSQEKNS